MLILHAYILRELLKTFALTVVALTGVFTMGGGLYNVLRYEGVTSADLIRVLPWLLPIVLTVTMPVAALFATTITYGRLAADNEFNACRAAGINVHYLFLSSLLLAVFVALLTVFSVNYVIPDFMKRIDRFARANLRDLAFYRLRQRGFIRYGQEGREQYVLTAQAVENVSNRALSQAGFEPQGGGLGYFWVDSPAFLWIDRDGELVQFTLARGGLCQFDTRHADVRVTVYVQDARVFEVGRASLQVRDQVIGPITVPIPLPLKPSMVDIETLARWRAAPWEAPEIAERIERARERLRVSLLLDHATRELSAGRGLELSDAQGRQARIEARPAAPESDGLPLRDVRVALSDPRLARPTRYSAPLGRLALRGGTSQPLHVSIELTATVEQYVLEWDARAAPDEPPRRRASAVVERLDVPAPIEQQVAGLSGAALLDPAAPAPQDEGLLRSLEKLRRDAGRLTRRVLATIHFRLGLASSALVTVVMGAMLGVIFRGSKALSAFGLACLPFGAVMLLTLTGRSLTESQAGQTLGPLVIWGGLAAVGLADVLLLRLGVRR